MINASIERSPTRPGSAAIWRSVRRRICFSRCCLRRSTLLSSALRDWMLFMRGPAADGGAAMVDKIAGRFEFEAGSPDHNERGRRLRADRAITAEESARPRERILAHEGESHGVEVEVRDFLEELARLLLLLRAIEREREVVLRVHVRQIGLP